MRQPSWIAKQRGDPPAPVLGARPPRLPQEFVAAFQEELGILRDSVPVSATEPDEASRQLEAGSEGESDDAAPHAPAPNLPDPELLAGLIDAVEQLAQSRSDVLDATAGQLAELAATIARRVIAHELSVSPEVVDGLVREGLEALGEHDRVVVRVGAGFATAVEVLRQRLSRAGQRTEVRVDPDLSEFGCVVETELGVVDESIDSRLAALLQALKPESAPPT